MKQSEVNKKHKAAAMRKKRRVSEYQTWIGFDFTSDCLKKNGRRLFSKSQGEETDKT